MPQERQGSPQGAGPGRSPRAQRASTVRKPSPAQSGRETYEATLTGRKKQAVSIRGRCARLCKKIRVYGKAATSMGEFIKVVERYAKPGAL